MTYREYFEIHEDENFSWCKPYFDESGEYCIVMLEGEPCGIVTPEVEIVSGYDGAQAAIDETIPLIAKAINPDYDLYSGWTNLHIALDAMRECGCANCPFKDDCEPMGEEMQETDYR